MIRAVGPSARESARAAARAPSDTAAALGAVAIARRAAMTAATSPSGSAGTLEAAPCRPPRMCGSKTPPCRSADRSVVGASNGVHTSSSGDAHAVDSSAVRSASAASAASASAKATQPDSVASRAEPVASATAAFDVALGDEIENGGATAVRAMAAGAALWAVKSHTAKRTACGFACLRTTNVPSPDAARPNPSAHPPPPEFESLAVPAAAHAAAPPATTARTVCRRSGVDGAPDTGVAAGAGGGTGVGARAVRTKDAEPKTCDGDGAADAANAAALATFI